MFYRLFLSDACLGKACYEKCKYKYDQSAADIRIGDAWGSHYKDDEKGVSAAIALTDKGNELLRCCNCELEPLNFDVVAEGQMKERVCYPPIFRKILITTFKNKRLSMGLSYQLSRVLGKFKKVIKRSY